jgi:hypothetical protein
MSPTPFARAIAEMDTTLCADAAERCTLQSARTATRTCALGGARRTRLAARTAIATALKTWAIGSARRGLRPARLTTVRTLAIDDRLRTSRKARTPGRPLTDCGKQALR